jgi:hypothetical protein
MRLGRPAAFALAGCCMLFLITAVFPFVEGYIIVSRSGQSTMGTFKLWMGVVGLVRTLLYVTAFSLLFVAVFVDRGAPAGLGERGKKSGGVEWTDEIA